MADRNPFLGRSAPPLQSPMRGGGAPGGR
ncbi:hypothetical protein NOCARDAX2BIS_610010 [Nocardioides sp. AX2bis]|nr:hypothetical protein NOCARDAX2BIS_610010 [Nocardioides sp. AX2bis]